MKEIVFKGENNEALTTSLLVAEKFGKEHKHVLEAIRNLINMKAEKSTFVEYQQLTKMFALIETEQPINFIVFPEIGENLQVSCS